MTHIFSSQISDILREQERITVRARERKGQRAVNKPDRQMLQSSFAGTQLCRGQGTHHIKTCFIPSAYPPSRTILAELQPIFLADLRLETHHCGKVLIVRTIGRPNKIVAIQNAIVDAQGEADRLSIYNYPLAASVDDILPIDAHFAIKEPYYKATTDGGYTIRVDHPSDIISLSSSHVCIPLALRVSAPSLSDSAASYKTRGNSAYRSTKYILAIEQYTRGLEVCEDVLLRCDLLRNRAIVNHMLKRFERASDDAVASLLSDEVMLDNMQRNTLNAKSLFRAGRANYEVMDYLKAASFFSDSLKLTPSDADIMRELDRTSQRILELDEDELNTTTLLQNPTSNLRLDVADHLRGIEIRDAGKHGRGLFATRAISSGSVIFAERALEAIFATDGATETILTININTKRGQYGPQATLLWTMIDRLRYSPNLARKFLRLYDGGYGSESKVQVVDENAIIDSFQVQAILEFNVFGFSSGLSADSSCQDEHQSSSAGIWNMASYVNHACASNAYRSIHGDLMLVHAVRDIAAGEEITMPYRDFIDDYDRSIEELQKTWRFRCDCEVCCIEEKIDPTFKKSRKAGLIRVRNLMSKHKQTRFNTASDLVVREMEREYHNLAKTYPKSTYKDRPRVELVAISLWLCQAHTTAGMTAKSLEAALEVLRNLGYGIVLEAQDISIDRSRAIARVPAVDAAVYAAQAQRILGATALFEAFLRFARSTHCIIYGHAHGFSNRYKIS